MRLVVDGQTYDRAKSISVSRDVRNYVGAFSARASEAEFGTFPIRPNSAVKVLNSVGGTLFDGFVENFGVTQSADSHEIMISGRDKTIDLVDSTLVEKQFQGPIEFEALCRLVISKQGLNIGVLNLATGLRRIEATELVSGDIGQGAMEFLDQYAARVQAFLTTNDDGRLVILKSDAAARSGLTLIRKKSAINNIKSSSITISGSKRFDQYVARSAVAAAGVGVALTPAEIVTQVGRAKDPGARPGRFYEFVAETPMDSAGLVDRARLEANVRRAGSLQYEAVIQGDSPSAAINTIVRVNDDTCGVDDDLLISSVKRVLSEQGTFTVINCTFSDSYSLNAQKTQIEQSRSTVK